MTLFSLTFALFILMDSVGNIPLFISFLKNLTPARQRFVILREMVIALILIVLFAYLGEALMNFLHIGSNTIQVAGGIILFILSLKMIFPNGKDPNEQLPHNTEPLVVPLAVPLIAGPAVLAAVMIYAKQEENNLKLVLAILIAWAASLIILLGSSFLKKILGWRGITTLERLMGLILTLIAVQMFLNGISDCFHPVPPIDS